MPSLTIAVLEDDPAVRRIIMRFLQQTGAEVQPLEPTQETAERLLAGEIRPDLMLVDRHLGTLDGYDLWQALAKRRPALARRTALLTGGLAPAGAPAELVTLQKPTSRETLAAWVATASAIED